MVSNHLTIFVVIGMKTIQTLDTFGKKKRKGLVGHVLGQINRKTVHLMSSPIPFTVLRTFEEQEQKKEGENNLESNYIYKTVTRRFPFPLSILSTSTIVFT